MAGSKKGKRKGRKKGKKGKKKPVLKIDPPPLHSLSELYQKIENLVHHLLECRVLARKKRIETQILQDEDMNQRRNVAVYKEHMNNKLDDAMADLKDISLLLTKEKESIQKEVDRINAEYQKRLTLTQERIAIQQKILEEIQNDLKQYEHLKNMVQNLEEQLAGLQDEYERIKVEIMIKTTHLRNQYLILRSELYNYLNEQLATLIAKVRESLLPIAWDQMGNEQRVNSCNRWSFKQEDETNSKLLKTRENYLRKLESLEWEKKYYGTEWAFSSLNEQKHQSMVEKIRWKKRLQEIYRMRSLYQTSKKKTMVAAEKPPLRIVADFQIFLQKKLSAISEARLRKEKHDRMKARKDGGTKTAVKQKTDSQPKDKRDSRLLSFASETRSHSSSGSSVRTSPRRQSDIDKELYEEISGSTRSLEKLSHSHQPSRTSQKDNITEDENDKPLQIQKTTESVSVMKEIIKESEAIFATEE